MKQKLLMQSIKHSSTSKYYLVHFGIGNVGKTLVSQLFKNKGTIKKKFGIDLVYSGIFGSKGGFYKKSGFTEKDAKAMFPRLSSPTITDPLAFLKTLPHADFKNTIIVDTTSSAEMVEVLSFALKNGFYAAISNKKPLSGKLSEFTYLQKFDGKFGYETTVGAGLPVIKVLKELLATGDEVVEISGCFSGTLGFICSALESGMPFSKSVAEAKEKGFTEPDPRDDLSGMDVARKALILARMIGKNLEMEDVAITALFPDSYKKYSVAEFVKKTAELDKDYKKRFANAASKNMTLRYVATVSSKGVSVGLKEVPKNSPLGNLNGPDNMIVVKTRRYFDNPMVIQGPGAGLEVTAAGVFGDILSLIAL